MSKKLFKNQMIMEIFSKKMLAILAYSLILYYCQLKTENNWRELGENSLLRQLYGVDGTGVGNFLYVALLPFCSCYLGSSLLKEDKKTGMSPLFAMRLGKYKYINTTTISSFFLGAIGAITPLVIEILLLWTKYPIIRMSRFSEWRPFYEVGYWGNALFFDHPVGFLLLMLFFYAFIGGCMAFLGLALSSLLTVNYLETVVLFFFWIIVWVISGFINIPQFSTVINLSFGYSAQFVNVPYGAPEGWLAGEIVWMLAAAVILVKRIHVKDVL